MHVVVHIQTVEKFVCHANKMCSLRGLLSSSEVESFRHRLTAHLENLHVDVSVNTWCIQVRKIAGQLTCVARSTRILENELREMCSNLSLGIIRTP